MGQTAVANKMTVGLVGQIATAHGMADASVVSAFNEEAATALVVGRFVKQGTKDDGALALSANTDILKGIACFGHEFERSVELDASGNYLPKTSFGCLKVGPITVAPTTAVTPTSQVHVQVVAEAGHDVGDIRATASVGKTLNISSLARWLTSAANAGDPAILFIDMTNVALAVAD